MKTAVVYYSLEGNARWTAGQVARRLGADLIELECVKPFPRGKVSKILAGGKSVVFKEKPALKPYAFDAAAYGHVILGTPVWAGSAASPLRTFLAREDLSGKAVSAFACCLSGEAGKAFDFMRDMTGREKLAAQMTLIQPLRDPEGARDAIEAFVQSVRESSSTE